MSSSRKFALVTALSSLIFGTVAATAIASVSSPDATTSAATLAQTSQQEKPAEQVVESDGFKFQLQRCQRASKKVTCFLLTTNLANKDRNLRLYSRDTRSFDFSGNEYVGQIVQVGKGKGQNYAQTSFIQGVPVKASVTFELPQSVTQLAVVEIVFYGLSSVKFRDVDIIGSK